MTSWPVSERCSEVGQPQNPSPPRTNTFMNVSSFGAATTASIKYRSPAQRGIFTLRPYQRLKYPSVPKNLRKSLTRKSDAIEESTIHGRDDRLTVGLERRVVVVVLQIQRELVDAEFAQRFESFDMVAPPDRARRSDR